MVEEQPILSKGGFSSLLWNCQTMEHLKTSARGYLGHAGRTPDKDLFIEASLKKVGLGPDGCAFWLSSLNAKNLGDAIKDVKSSVVWEKQVLKFTRRAFVHVAIWSHPDYDGSTRMTTTLIGSFRSYFEKKIVL